VQPTILIVDDEKHTREGLRDSLEDSFDVYVAADIASALNVLESEHVDLVLTDLRLGGKRDGGLQVMAVAGMLSPDAMVLVLTAYPDDSNRQASFRLGALHFLEKPVDLATIAQHAATVGVRSAFAQTNRT
jgi:DNA-binding NtrC family response regulator